MKYIVDEVGKIRSSDDVELADKIIELKKKKDIWIVIDELLKVWLKRSPEETEAVKIDVKDQRELLIDKKYGQTKEGGNLERRFQLLFPTSLMLLIRSIYKVEELPFNREFYKVFTTRYPGFKIASIV